LCFLNAALQALLNIEPFVYLLLINQKNAVFTKNDDVNVALIDVILEKYKINSNKGIKMIDAQNLHKKFCKKFRLKGSIFCFDFV
jgi:hypothetical protein